MIGFKRLTETATIPTKGTQGAAAFDLYADEDITITANSPPVTVSTGIACNFPYNHYGKIESRSGLGLKYGVVCHGGVIDADYYPGNIKVIISSKLSFNIKRGDRVAQMVVLPYWSGEVVELDDTNVESDHTGFGSTGI